MTSLETRIRRKLERFSELLGARDPAAADELGQGGAAMFGSEAHEKYFTRDEIAEHLAEIYAKPFRLGFDWKTIRPDACGGVVWAVVEADMVLDFPDGSRRAMPYRLTCIFEDTRDDLRWRLFSGSEPAPPPSI
jgi:hypothetical protein